MNFALKIQNHCPAQSTVDFLALAMGSGDVHGLALALDAPECEVRAEIRAAAGAELARLEGVAKRFGIPGWGCADAHAELLAIPTLGSVEVGAVGAVEAKIDTKAIKVESGNSADCRWVAHGLRFDAAGRLFVRTKVGPFCIGLCCTANN